MGISCPLISLLPHNLSFLLLLPWHSRLRAYEAHFLRLTDSASVSNFHCFWETDWAPMYWGQLCTSRAAVAWGSAGKWQGVCVCPSGDLACAGSLRLRRRSEPKITVIFIIRTRGKRKSERLSGSQSSITPVEEVEAGHKP